jgi:hypothetical protein
MLKNPLNTISKTFVKSVFILSKLLRLLSKKDVLRFLFKQKPMIFWYFRN